MLQVCLLDQKFLLDDSKTVRQAVAGAGKEVGVPLRLAAFVRVQVGDGIHRQAGEGGGFAAEVAQMVK